MLCIFCSILWKNICTDGSNGAQGLRLTKSWALGFICFQCPFSSYLKQNKKHELKYKDSSESSEPFYQEYGPFQNDNVKIFSYWKSYMNYKYFMFVFNIHCFAHFTFVAVQHNNFLALCTTNCFTCFVYVGMIIVICYSHASFWL